MEILHTLGIDPRLLLITVVNFLVLLAVLRRFLFGPVANLLAARTDEVKQRLDSAQESEEQARRHEQELESRLASIQDEARHRIQEAVEEARVARERLLQEARADAEQVLSRAREDIARDARHAMMDLRNEVADLAIMAASRAVGAGLDEGKHRKAIADFLTQLEAEAK